MLLEAAGGWWSGSLALLADAGHMLFDLLALGVAVGAQTLGRMPADDKRTFGYRRFEVLGALLNSLALVVIALWIAYEALERWQNPQPVATGSMLLVAVVGLVANLLGLWLLHGSHHDLNTRGAFLHLLGDTLSSVGVIIGACVIAQTGWLWIDPILSVLIGLVIVIGSAKLMLEVVDVLLESVPNGMSAQAVRARLQKVDGVKKVHHLHLWSISTALPALSAHVVVDDAHTHPYALRRKLAQTLLDDFGIAHSTLQLEDSTDSNAACDVEKS